MRVLVTRPEHETRRWIAALAQQGIDAQAWPLIDIRPVSDPAPVRAVWQDCSAFCALMFVSAAAVEHFFAARPPGAAWPAGALPRAWATGPGTVAALVREGVPGERIDAPAPDSGQFDSEALWRVVGDRVRPGQRVLLVRGADADGAQGQPQSADAGQGHGRDWLAQQLREAGAQVEFLVSYWRAPPRPGAQQLALARAAATDGTIWLFTSGQAIGNLLACLPGQDWSGAHALATHPRIAAAARAAGFGVVRASRPALPDVVASIKSGDE